jgi:hypothetical protein
MHWRLLAAIGLVASAIVYRLTCRLDLTQREQELLTHYGGTSMLEHLLQTGTVDATIVTGWCCARPVRQC